MILIDPIERTISTTPYRDDGDELLNFIGDTVALLHLSGRTFFLLDDNGRLKKDERYFLFRSCTSPLALMLVGRAVLIDIDAGEDGDQSFAEYSGPPAEDLAIAFLGDRRNVVAMGLNPDSETVMIATQQTMGGVD